MDFDRCTNCGIGNPDVAAQIIKQAHQGSCGGTERQSSGILRFERGDERGSGILVVGIHNSCRMGALERNDKIDAQQLSSDAESTDARKQEGFLAGQ